MANRSFGQRHLVLLLLCSALWLVVAMPVFSQEAYYWTYSEHPALSYFDHPPMVAWLIMAGTALLGDGAAGIRLGTVLCGLGVVALGRLLLRDFGAGESAQRCWLLLCVSVPFLVMTRFLASPDAPLVCFWLLCLFALHRARGGSLRWWLLAGLAAGLALLSKYTAAFLMAGGVLVLLLDAPMRRQLLRPGPWLALLVAALTFLPVIVWNVSNGFESFRFQTTHRWANSAVGVRWILQLLGGQLLVLNPIVAVILPVAGVWLCRRCRRDHRPLWLLAFGLPLPAFMLVNSLFIQVKINWLEPAWVALLLGVAWWWAESGWAERHQTAVRRGAVALFAFASIVVLAPLIRLVPQNKGSSWSGWARIAERAEEVEEVLDSEDGVEGNVFFFANNYKDAAQLSRGLKMQDKRSEPGDVLEPTLAQNVFGDQALQFDHWEPPGRRVGQDAVLVLTRPERRAYVVDLARQRFGSIKKVDRLVVRALGIPLQTVDIYACRKYLGPMPRSR